MSDYIKLHKAGGIKVGLCEIQGRRPSQEDFMTVATAKQVKEFSNLDLPQRDAVLMNTFAQLQKTYGQVKQIGSTACVVTAWINPKTSLLQITTAHVGDSAAYLIIVDDAYSSIVLAKRINELHNPDPNINFSEYERVVQIAKPTRFMGLGPLRLNGELAMTRSFGDKKYEKFGLLHTPEITHFQKTLSKSQKVYIVLACDGLTEEHYIINSKGETVAAPVVSVDEMAKIIHVMRRKYPLDKIAEHLVDYAYLHGSQDNISVAVFEVGVPISAAIFDGHNGVISYDLGKNFYKVFEKNSKEKVILNSKPKKLRVKRS